jgi:hypothetical protein
MKQLKNTSKLKLIKIQGKIPGLVNYKLEKLEEPDFSIHFVVM